MENILSMINTEHAEGEQFSHKVKVRIKDGFNSRAVCKY